MISHLFRRLIQTISERLLNRKEPGVLDIGTKSRSIDEMAATLIHELGHAADIFHGDSASKFINDYFSDNKEKSKKAQEKNRQTNEDCKEYIKSLLKK